MKVDFAYRDELNPFFERLNQKLVLLNQNRPLPAMALGKIKEALSVEWTYNSNGIEGNTLSLRETQMVLQEGITVKGKSLREHFEAKNHERAINYLYKLVEENESISVKDMLSLHSLVMNSIEEDFAGRLRNGGVRIAGANFVPPNALKVLELLEDLVTFVVENPLQLNAIEMATVFHHQFVWIHPFFDGNGRTVRLAMNLLLMQAGFPPAIILRNDRKKYYMALNEANKGRYYKLMLLMAQALERTLNIYLEVLPGNSSEYKEISNLVEEEHLPYGQEYISLLARTGKIDAYKQGRNWLTTKEAVENYIKSRKRKR
uniref:Fic family protein n=1 Tax=Aestuariivivens insulae TaxID=1621988 RepID=UPI00293E6735|nr:Fic family protein [Aestuariivivens insulae]